MKLNPQQQEQLAAAKAVVSPERARQLQRLKSWEHGGCLLRGAERPQVVPVSAAEDLAIRKLWDTLPGWASWMTALSLLAKH